VEESIRIREDRDKWRKYVHGVENPWIEDGYGTEQTELNERMSDRCRPPHFRLTFS